MQNSESSLIRKSLLLVKLLKNLRSLTRPRRLVWTGDNYFYLHVDKNNLDEDKVHEVSLDSASLDETYLEQGNYEELPEYEN